MENSHRHGDTGCNVPEKHTNSLYNHQLQSSHAVVGLCAGSKNTGYTEVEAVDLKEHLDQFCGSLRLHSGQITKDKGQLRV